jgi:hypothetical protein
MAQPLAPIPPGGENSGWNVAKIDRPLEPAALFPPLIRFEKKQNFPSLIQMHKVPLPDQGGDQGVGIPAWAQQYVGIPFKPHGRNRATPASAVLLYVPGQQYVTIQMAESDLRP